MAINLRLLEDLAAVIARSYSSAIAPIQKRIDAMDARVQSLSDELATEHAREVFSREHFYAELADDRSKRAILDTLDAQFAEWTETIESLENSIDACVQLAHKLSERVEQIEQTEILPGPAGRDGKDADPELIRQLVREAVNEIPPPQDGKSITVEDVRPMIATMVRGCIDSLPVPKDGKDGKDADSEMILQMVISSVHDAVRNIEIPTPRDGADGRDAIDIEILAAIDETRSYPRGTYALHSGGLWRSFERTSGLRGWECVVNGIARIDVHQSDDGRTFSVDLEMSNGELCERSFRLNHCIDRGVYATVKDYLTGDGVTHLGSYWIAKCDLPKEAPGQNTDEWRLAVRKGRDAKK